MPALKIGVSELSMEAKPAVENWVAMVIRVKGSAVLISPSTTKCFRLLMKGFHCPAQSIIGTRVKAAIRDLTALRGMAPNSLTEIRANRKEDPQIAAVALYTHLDRELSQMPSELVSFADLYFF